MHYPSASEPPSESRSDAAPLPVGTAAGRRPAVGEPPADTVFVGGTLYRPGRERSEVGALAVRGDRIVAVGDETVVRTHVGPSTAVVDLDGGLLVPGFQDSHIHPILGGVERLQCDLSGAVTREACFAAIREYAAARPDESWVLGSGWAPSYFADGVPHRTELDELVPDRPALLGSQDHHSVWANSAALALADITSSTPDPEDGRIGRDSDGTPNGNLYEGAMALIRAHAPKVDLDLAVAGLLETQRYLHSLGVTSWQDAILGYDLPLDLCIDAYIEAERRGALSMRTTGCVWWERDRGTEQLSQVREAEARLRAGVAASRWRATGVKIMVDGVTESGTAALSQPYRDACGHVTGRLGDSYFDAAALKEHLVAIDAAGYAVHFHAIGDRAVTEALDAVEAARAANRSSGVPHHIAHLQLIRKEDIARFAQLNATANLQMFWAVDAPPNTEHTIPFISPDFADRLYPFGELWRADAPLAAGSDWPVTTPDPLAGIHVGVNRTLGGGYPFGGAEQRIPLATALTAYTAGTARINRQEHETGALEPGLLADFAIIDRDLFDLEPHEIQTARVTRTYVGGRLVYAA